MANQIFSQTKSKKIGVNFNEEQMRAVKALQGVSIVNAGAGTGKTSVIVGKINYATLLYPCSSVLAISFTKKAVAEITSRIAENVNVMCSTFHSFFYRILRANGYKKFRFIENDGVKRQILQSIIDKFSGDGQITVENIIDIISRGKKNIDSAEVSIINYYFDVLKNRKLLCFDSLQHFCLELLKKQPKVAFRVGSYYDYVLIDEAQDLSDIQAEIIKLIWPVEQQNNLTLVGDPYQSIYGFRGSKADVMQELADYYNADVYNLFVNYRSTEAILTLAHTVLPVSSMLKSMKGEGVEPMFYRADNTKKEAQWVVEEVKRLHSEGSKLKDIAILFRSAIASKDIYNLLIEEKVPFIKVGSDGFKWNNSKFKHFLSLIALAYEPDNAMYKWALQLLGISKNVLMDLDGGATMPFSKKVLSIPSLSEVNMKILKEFFSVNPRDFSLQDYARYIWNSYLKKYYKTDNDVLLENFLEEIHDFNTWLELKEHIIAVRCQTKQMSRLAGDPSADYLRLMSIHSSKGMEFQYVFLIGAVDGILPALGHDSTDIIEENRLAYVAVTRAKKQIYVSFSKSKKKNCYETSQPSRFFIKYFA